MASILFWVYWSVCIVLYFILVTLAFVATFPFDRYHQIPNRILKGLGFLMIRANPGWSVQFDGIEHYERGQPTVFVANHQSFLDMPLTYLLPWTMKWVAKKSLFHIPILGWIIYMTGHLGIDRESLRSVKLLDKLVEPIHEGIPAMFFPEGTRTTTGDIGRFKNGAFTLARQYNFTLQPLVLEGGYAAMPSGSWRFNFKADFYVSILPAVDPGEFKSTEELREHVREAMTEKLDSIRRANRKKKASAN